MADPPATTPERPPSSMRRPSLPKGMAVGDYDITGTLGSGSFGHVYSAVHRVIGKRAALKVLHVEHMKSASLVRRFLSEAKAVNAIQHRGIVDIFDFGQLDDGRQFFAMELLEGETLEDRLLRDGCLNLEDGIPILRRIARALDAAHKAGIAHRDLKPENIFLTVDDESEVQPKLLDFGIAKLMTEGHNSQTQTGQMLGTPLYMSPEQWRGKKVDHRTDVWSLGVVAYQMLTGQLPFDGESPGDVMINVCTESPTPLRQHVPRYAGAIEISVERMLAKFPDQRPSSATEAVRRMSDAAALIESGLVMDTFDPTTSDPGASLSLLSRSQTDGLRAAVDRDVMATLPMNAEGAPAEELLATEASHADGPDEDKVEANSLEPEAVRLTAEPVTAASQDVVPIAPSRRLWPALALLGAGAVAGLLVFGGEEAPAELPAPAASSAPAPRRVAPTPAPAVVEPQAPPIPVATAASTASVVAHPHPSAAPAARPNVPARPSPPAPPPVAPPPVAPPPPPEPPPPKPTPPPPPPPGGIDLPVDTR